MFSCKFFAAYKSGGGAVAMCAAVIMSAVALGSCSNEAPLVTVRSVDADSESPSGPSPRVDSKKETTPGTPQLTTPVTRGTPGTTPAARAPVTWAVVSEKVIVPRCSACHGKGTSLDLTTYEGFMGVAPTAYGLVFFTTDPENKMPPGPDLTAEQKQVLADYLADGLKP